MVLSDDDRKSLEEFRNDLDAAKTGVDHLFGFSSTRPGPYSDPGGPEMASPNILSVSDGEVRPNASPAGSRSWIVSVLAEGGLGTLVAALVDGSLPGEALLPTFDRAYFEAMRTVIFAAHPELKKFDGEFHGARWRVRKLDQQRMKLARDQIAYEHASRLPRTTGGIGPFGVLNGEVAKKRNHLPIRQFLERAGTVIQQIKPIFLMSSLSVAQFLKPGSVSFDLLVVDEASQIEPVDALGAVARCRQMVVVGDERQLPPTRFFAKLTGNDDDPDEDDEMTFRAKDAESILDLCLAKGLPHRMLNWHYRSKHQSLIAVSTSSSTITGCSSYQVLTMPLQAWA